MSDPAPPIPTILDPDHPHEVWIIQPTRQRLWLHIVLLGATFVSTSIVGTWMQGNFARHQPAFYFDDNISMFPVELLWQAPAKLVAGLPFCLTLMFILLAHEMGHYLYARRHHVYVTLPYFIPFPSLIGTLGAFIRIKSPIPSRAALFDIGIAGPIAGFIPSCVAVLAGLSLSQPLAAAIPAGDHEPGFPLAFHLAAHLLRMSPPATLSLHPIAMAGWVGMFATALNLLPGGQLDGGHILYAISPRLHRWISLATVLALIPLAKYGWIGWLLWSVILWMTSHHPPIPVRAGLSAARKRLALSALFMLVLAFAPAPITNASGRGQWPAIRQWLHRR
jgi:membrane-associated protease RseP (regulator of RpoE activity)